MQRAISISDGLIALTSAETYFSVLRTLSNTSWNISVVSRPVFVL